MNESDDVYVAGQAVVLSHELIENEQFMLELVYQRRREFALEADVRLSEVHAWWGWRPELDPDLLHIGWRSDWPKVGDGNCKPCTWHEYRCRDCGADYEPEHACPGQ